MTFSSVSFALATISILLLRPASAQEATVFLEHPPKTGDKKPVVQLSYQLPGEDINTRHAGVPALIAVPQGSVACFKVERANPLLYTYTVGSKIIKVETPDTVSQIMRQLLALAPKATLPGQGFLPADQPVAGDPVGPYEASVGQLFRIRTEMETLKLSSDTAINLVELAHTGTTLALAAADTNTTADASYKALSDATKKLLTVRLLRASQLDEADKAKHLGEEFNAVESLLKQPLCSAPVTKDRLHVALSIAGKTGIGADNLKKATGDEIASFDVEPRSNVALDFGPGIILNTLAHPSKTFALSGGTITQAEGDQLLFRPAILANLRSWGPEWIWATVGLSGDKEGISDLFAGVTGRFGYAVAGARLALGVGLAATRLPTGLSKGSVGQPLPADIASLDKILRKSLVPGFGVMLMATGF